MISQKLQYFIYGSLLSASLITFAAGATGTNGVFGDYFTNMIQDASGCGANTAITGFDASLGVNYGKQECSTFQNIVKSALKSFGLAPAGQAVTGFDSGGNPIFGDVNWHKNSNDISYMGGKVGIGTNAPGAMLDIVGKATTTSTIAGDTPKTLTTKDYVDARISVPTGTCPSGQFVVSFTVWGSVVCAAPSYIYNWASGSFGACSKTCGGGTQTRSVDCKRSDGVVVADSYCSAAKPTMSQSCNTASCVVSLDTFEGCGMYCGYSPNEGNYRLYGTLTATNLNLTVTHICRYPSKCGGTSTFSKTVTAPIGSTVSGNFNDLNGGGGHAWKYQGNCLYIYRNGDWNHRVGCF